MNKSKAEYAICNIDKCVAIVWKTDIGRVVVVQDKIDINGDLSVVEIKNTSNGKVVDNVDLRNLIMEILPREE